MSDHTRIEWCDATINPLVGCTPVSEGCEHCYAARMASRNLCPQWQGTAKGGKWTGKIKYIPSEWDKPRHWRKARRIFVCSMSDPFNSDVPEQFSVDLIFAVKDYVQHTFMLLTKRPENIYKLSRLLSSEVDDLPFDNLWLGITAENQKRFDERWPRLSEANVAHRFLSAEPLLGPLNIQCSIRDGAIQHVIAGGENGHGARPCHPDWVRSIRDQCQECGIPFFFKGWGEWSPDEQPGAMRYPWCDRYFWRVGKKRSGRLLDGREWNEVPE